MIAIERVDHIGIRVRDLERSLNFYRVLGFDLLCRADGDDGGIVRDGNGVELSLIFNANAGHTNVLMDVPEKYPGYTHMALRVGSIPATIARSEGQRYRDHTGTGQLRREWTGLGLRPRSGS